MSAGAMDIRDGDQVLARFIAADWRPGLSFHSQDQDYIQVGTWVYDAAKELPAHVHNDVARTVMRTQEVIFVRKGRLRAFIYTREGRLVREIDARAGDVLVMLDGAHGYRIDEDGTEVLEVKGGPYLGAERDRTRIAPHSP